MKKHVGIALVMVFVLALSSMALAAEGSLAGGETVKADIKAYATVGPYASIVATKPVDFGTLVGKVGLYTANGFDHGGTSAEFYGRAADVFGVSSDLFVSNNDGWGSFNLETNTNVMVGISFDNTGWLDSPTLFAIAKEGAPDVPKAWAGSNVNLTGLATEFGHAFAKNSVQMYGIDGAIYIERISQQMAQNYEGLITVTVSLPTAQ